MTNKDVAMIEKKLSPIEEQAKALEVIDEKTEHQAATLLSQLNLVGDAMKERKAAVYDPAWQTVVAIRAEWKPKETMLEAAITLVRGKMNKYRTAAKAAADAEAAKIASRIGDGKGKLKIATAVKQIEAIEQPTGAVATSVGIVKYDTIEKFEVMDVTMLPVEYLLANEVLIRSAMRKGVKIPGVRYYEEQVPKNFR